MARKVKNLNLQIVSKAAEAPTLYADEHLYVTMHDFRLADVRDGVPYRVDEGRVVMVTRGWVRAIVNLEERRLERQSLVMLMPDGIFEILECSPDFDMKAFAFKELPFFTAMKHETCLSLSDDEWRLANGYVDLMWHEVQRRPVQTEAIKHLQTALILDIKQISERQETASAGNASRQEKLFRGFLDLVKAHGLQERRIEFYASSLCVTPGHLGAVVRKGTGLTVMQWLNRHTVQRAKVLLRYSDLPIWEVAERMNFATPSFFSKFFRKETGLTPGAYRQGK